MIKNCIRTNSFISVTLDDGTILVSQNPDDDFVSKVFEAKTKVELAKLFHVVTDDKPIASDNLTKLCDGEIVSDYLEYRGASVYIPSISELTVPQDFAEAVLDAELNNNEDLIRTYLNFWTLVSLNPDSRVRDNIFWFIRRWGIKITKSGLLVTYRNADFVNGGAYDLETIEKVTNDYVKIKSQKKGPKHYYYEDDVPTSESKLKRVTEDISDDVVTLQDWYERVTNEVDTTTFTDQHSHTFKIKIGTPVSMPREKTDRCQENSCSAGLHQGAPAWLEKNYFGDTGLVCLVNPANVVAIPTIDNYGKLRCCEYLPIAIAKFGDDGHIIEDIDVSGYEDGYILDYAGKVNNEDLNQYTINFVNTIGIDRKAIADRIFAIAGYNNDRN